MQKSMEPNIGVPKKLLQPPALTHTVVGFLPKAPLVPPQEPKSAVVSAELQKPKPPLLLGTIILPLGLLTSPPLAPQPEVNHVIAQGVPQKLM